MNRLLITFIVLFISMGNLHSQWKLTKGTVISEDFENLPGASIMIDDTIEVGKTSVDFDMIAE